MNHLEQLKQQLMIKPDVKEREHVAVVIKGEKRQKKPKIAIEKKKTDTNIAELFEEGITGLGEQISEIQQIQGILPVTVDLDEFEEKDDEVGKQKRPVIIDKTHEGYDTEALFKKLAENKKTKVTVKPVLEIETKEIQKEPERVVKKAKKIDIKKPLIIEGEDDEDDKEEKQDEEDAKDQEDKKEEEEFVMKPKKKVEFKEESPEEIVLKKKEEDVIPIIPPKQKQRKTQKLEKGVAVLGPEVIVEMGDTDLRKRLPKKSPPINIKVSSYIMNNREIFVNFINSLFQPYKRELE